MSGPAPEEEGFVIRLRGLPWTATAEEVVGFFKGLDIVGAESGVKFLFSREGRASGEAFVEFTNEDDVQVAVKKHNEHMGSRYVEVFKSKKSEMDWVIKRSGSTQTPFSTEAVLRLRGLPFGCSKEEIAQFFTGLEIVPNGIMLPEDRQGRSTGEAYVQFAAQEIAEKALTKHMERIGHRYIEIFKSTPQEAFGAMGQPRTRNNMGMNRPGPYDRNERFGNMGMNNMGGGGGGGMGGGMMSGGGMGGGMGGGGGMGNYGRGRGRNVKGFYDDDYEDFGGGYASGFGGNRRGKMNSPQRGRFQQQQGGQGRQRGLMPGSQHSSVTGHSVHMRGLPYQAIDADIRDFFAPQKPVRVEFEFQQNGQSTGEANVDFGSHQEALEAMKHHKKNMQHRYIELFCNSTPGGLEGNSGGFGGDMGQSGNTGGDFSGNMGGGNMGGGGYNGGNNMGGGGYNNSSNNMGGGGYNSGGGGGGGGNFGGGGGNMNNYNMGGGGGGGYGNNMGQQQQQGGQGMNNMMGNPNYTAF